MLFDLSFLSQGQPWPPECEKARLERYTKNRSLFDGDHADVYAEQFKRIERVIGNFQQIVSYAFVANYQKLISLKMADLLFNEQPKMTAGDEGSLEQDRLSDIIDGSRLHTVDYKVAIDVSRYGAGIYQVYENDGKGRIGVVRPDIWFPVVDASNVDKVHYHVLAWKVGPQGKETSLMVRIHESGYIEERQYELKDGRIGRPLTETVRRSSGLTGNAIIVVPNLQTSDKAEGYDDYVDVDSTVAELLVRVSQLNKLFDKFTDPTMQGPRSAMVFNKETETWEFKPGRFYVREDKDEPPVEMIVWDAKVEENFKMIELLTNTLYRVSEVGSLIFMDQAMKQGDATGPGMKRIHAAALAKANRVKMNLDPALREAIAAASQIGSGVRLEAKAVSIGWQDGLPEDPQEQATYITTLYGAGLMSLETALRRLGLEGEALEAEMERIRADRAADAAFNVPFNLSRLTQNEKQESAQNEEEPAEADDAGQVA